MKLTKTKLKQIIREEIKKLNESETNIMKLDPEEQKQIVAQYEAIRKAGQFNMMDFLSVQRAAFENGYYEFVNFTQNNNRAYGSILKNYGKLMKTIKSSDIPNYKKLKTSYSV